MEGGEKYFVVRGDKTHGRTDLCCAYFLTHDKHDLCRAFFFDVLSIKKCTAKISTHDKCGFSPSESSAITMILRWIILKFTFLVTV
jgi:hypothetical protein